MNIIVFSADDPYRNKPCTFFLMIAAIAHSVHLLSATLTRILATGFDKDFSTMSIVWCKMRQYNIATAAGISLTCQWLAAVDQFLITSRSVRLRQLSCIKRARRIGIGVAVFWIVQSVPYLVFVDLRSNVCTICNSFWQVYNAYIDFWCFYTILPVLMMTIFGILAYRNVRALKDMRKSQGVDRQLTHMVCGQIVLIIVYVAPYATFNAYSLITAAVIKTLEQKSIDYLLANITGLLSVFGAGGTFYIFLLVSSKFRKQVKRRLYCGLLKSNTILPANGNITTI
ncbi:unnamed protein product [Adineta ricciae]|uniref:G-protein coupled receptors family 1 profile domain-containing protein n=1 Tax=Adineta ricciae TaxID=249248 RepID=A0A813QV62_ADIRI|nr:unnamed protein product [Adineta ricciae]CAF1147725.1 unnamed protein product [Adineta ricciae]